MADKNPGVKIIAVSKGAEREAYLLKQILNVSGRDVFSVLPAAEAAERGLKAVLLLAPEVSALPAAPVSPVCVTKFLPEAENLPGFQKVITYSTEWDDADFTARNIRMLAENVTAFEIVGVGIIGRVRLRFGGEETVGPALAAVAAAIAAGVPFAETLKALNQITSA